MRGENIFVQNIERAYLEGFVTSSTSGIGKGKVFGATSLLNPVWN